MAEQLYYVPMPANVVSDMEMMCASEIKDPGGKPLYAVTN